MGGGVCDSVNKGHCLKNKEAAVIGGFGHIFKLPGKISECRGREKETNRPQVQGQPQRCD